MATDLPGFTVYVTPKLFATLRTLSAKEGRSLSNFVAVHLHGQFGSGDVPLRKKPRTQNNSTAS
jgi:hypothetical protein